MEKNSRSIKVNCEHCKKSMLKSNLNRHLKICPVLKNKEEAETALKKEKDLKEGFKKEMEMKETEMKRLADEDKARYKEENRRKEEERRQEALDRQFTCPTCLEIFIQPVALSCSHT